ncbi:MAG: carbamoyltransferase C-terminal domain-containing protein [bacterium]
MNNTNTKQYHMGINMGHDRSVAIVKDGELVVAIEQERLDRNKHSVGYMLQSPVTSQIQVPVEACRYCLETCEIKIENLATITPNMPGQDIAPDIIRNTFLKYVADKVLRIPSHHLAHAYSAFWPSGFDEALILVVDATGSTDASQRTESYTLYEGRGTTITPLHAEKVAAHLAGLSTLGFIYEYVTRKAGFVTSVGPALRIAEAGKLMGLAPYGGEQINWHRWIRAEKDSYSLGISAYDIFLEVAALEKRYDRGEGKAYFRPYLVDLAYKVQKELEEVLLHLVDLAMKQTGLRKLCIAGGVGLNSVANYQLLHHLKLDDIFIFPAAGDSGIAAGSALWAYHTIEGGDKRPQMRRATLGRGYTADEVSAAVRKFESSIMAEELTPSEMIARSAEALKNGHIVARFEGGSEYGPRALGHRSIMVDPTFSKMKDILNARVKHREAFRPFAPVIPLENISEVFEQKVASPFMLVVPMIKKELQKQIPAVTHQDGTGRVQTVTEEDNSYFYQLCHKLVELRKGPPVLLNTSFNVAGQPIVETPKEAIETFLSTDIDYLSLENYWISKRDVPVLSYEANAKRVAESAMPKGLPPEQPGVTDLMEKLDRALFFGDTTECPWSDEELRNLSSLGGLYKETSVLFPETPFSGPLRTQLSENVVLLLDPLGKSKLVDLSQHRKPSSYTFDEVKILLAVSNASQEEWETLRLRLRLTTLEFDRRVQWAIDQLGAFGIKPKHGHLQQPGADSKLPGECNQTFAPFEDENFSARQALLKLNECLSRAGYTKENICSLLGINSLQEIEPTRLCYYDQFLLPGESRPEDSESDNSGSKPADPGLVLLADLIRLFQLRAALPEERLCEIFTAELFKILVSLGMLIRRGEEYASRVDLFCAEGLYLATDHRFMILPEDQIDESPVMYLGLDSMGLVYTAPQCDADQLLDLCCGSGVQGLVASRYARQVTCVDINPRSIRFSRFNAQLNGIRNVRFCKGNLYEPVRGRKFDTILANPPFVPSPKSEYRFRDGGGRGEDILSRIIKESAHHLAKDGKLFIVSDLVDVESYQSKLDRWWQGGAAHKLVLQTANRNDILFSVPHSHAPFGQSFEEYNAELAQWLRNFHKEKMTAVNFGYILICRLPEGKTDSYYTRTIHNPTSPIHQQVKKYFDQRKLLENGHSSNKFILLSHDLYFRVESNHRVASETIELFSPHNPYFTTYKVSDQVYRMLRDIDALQPRLGDFLTPANREWLYDFIYKGILYLSDERIKDRGSQQQKAAVDSFGMWIQEQQTKTTPTCLSAYLCHRS